MIRIDPDFQKALEKIDFKSNFEKNTPKMKFKKEIEQQADSLLNTKSGYACLGVIGYIVIMVVFAMLHITFSIPVLANYLNEAVVTSIIQTVVGFILTGIFIVWIMVTIRIASDIVCTIDDMFWNSWAGMKWPIVALIILLILIGLKIILVSINGVTILLY